MSTTKPKLIHLPEELIAKGNVVASMSGMRLKGFIEDHISKLIELEYKTLFAKDNGHTD